MKDIIFIFFFQEIYVINNVRPSRPNPVEYPLVTIRSARPDSENRKCIYREGFSKARRTGKNEHAGKEEFVRISRLHASFVTGDSVNFRSGYGTRRCIYSIHVYE